MKLHQSSSGGQQLVKHLASFKYYIPFKYYTQNEVKTKLYSGRWLENNEVLFRKPASFLLKANYEKTDDLQKHRKYTGF